MKVVVVCVGETDQGYLSEGCKVYADRLQHYIPFELQCISEAKSWKKKPLQDRKNEEGKAILNLLQPGDIAVLLDERGRSFTSESFAESLQSDMLRGTKRLVFIIGGAFGFSQAVYDAVPRRMAISTMTFSHQMVRLFFFEQLYRAMTILRNEPYHNR